MQRFKKHEFNGLADRDGGASFSDMEFADCVFSSCLLSYTRKPEARSLVERSGLIGCTSINSKVGPAILRDVLIDTLLVKGRTPVYLWGTVFERVRLRGKIGNLLINPHPPLVEDPAGMGLWSQLNAEFYEKVEWALDISEAEFSEVRLAAVPGHLVRRDPRTQALLRREQALRLLQLTDDRRVEPFWTSARMLRDSPYDSVVLPACKASRYFKRELDNLKLLRDEGLVELEG